MANSSLGPWETIKLVDKGGSSSVFKARFTESGQIIAVKQIDTDCLSKDQVLGIKGEIDTMKGLSHPNIISYLGTQQTSNRIYIFLEFADRGSLRQYYRKKGPLKESQVINCTRQILNGLSYLHKNGIAHRDIKCANCLLTLKGSVKLADFGASKKYESESLVSGLKGTPNWMAPEVIKGTQMTYGWMKADVWSLGCTIVEMLTGKLPFSEFDNPMTAMYHIANGKAPSLEQISCSEELKDFIKSCCRADPSHRPTVDQLLSHFLITKSERLHANGDIEMSVNAVENTSLQSELNAQCANSNLAPIEQVEPEKNKALSTFDTHSPSAAQSIQVSADEDNNYDDDLFYEDDSKDGVSSLENSSDNNLPPFATDDACEGWSIEFPPNNLSPVPLDDSSATPVIRKHKAISSESSNLTNANSRSSTANNSAIGVTSSISNIRQSKDSMRINAPIRSKNRIADRPILNRNISPPRSGYSPESVDVISSRSSTAKRAANRDKPISEPSEAIAAVNLDQHTIDEREIISSPVQFSPLMENFPSPPIICASLEHLPITPAQISPGDIKKVKAPNSIRKNRVVFKSDIDSAPLQSINLQSNILSENIHASHSNPLPQTENPRSKRPIAPLSSDKLNVHNPKKDTFPPHIFEKASQTNAAVIRKAAALELLQSESKVKRKDNKKILQNSNNLQTASTASLAVLKESANQASSHASKRSSKKRSGKVRSQSAGVPSSNSTLLPPNKLPPMTTTSLNAPTPTGSILSPSKSRIGSDLTPSSSGSNHSSRHIQSAPAVSRSLNLPPLLPSFGTLGNEKKRNLLLSASVDQK